MVYYRFFGDFGVLGVCWLGWDLVIGGVLDLVEDFGVGVVWEVLMVMLCKYGLYVMVKLLFCLVDGMDVEGLGWVFVVLCVDFVLVLLGLLVVMWIGGFFVFCLVVVLEVFGFFVGEVVVCFDVFCVLLGEVEFVCCCVGGLMVW